MKIQIKLLPSIQKTYHTIVARMYSKQEDHILFLYELLLAE